MKMRSFTPDPLVHGDEGCEHCEGSGVAAVKVERVEGFPTPNQDAVLVQIFALAQQSPEIQKGCHIFLLGNRETSFALARDVPWQSNLFAVEALIGMGHRELAEAIGPPEFVVLFDGDPQIAPERVPGIIKNPGDKIDAAMHVITKDSLLHALMTYDGNGRGEYLSVSNVENEGEDDMVFRELSRLQRVLIDGVKTTE